MRLYEILKESAVGKIVQDVNTTADVQPGEVQRQANKLGLELDDDGEPKLISPSGEETEEYFKE